MTCIFWCILQTNSSPFSYRHSLLTPKLIQVCWPENSPTREAAILLRNSQRHSEASCTWEWVKKMDQKSTWHLYFHVQSGEQFFAWVVGQSKKICKFARGREISLAKKILFSSPLTNLLALLHSSNLFSILKKAFFFIFFMRAHFVL